MKVSTFARLFGMAYKGNPYTRQWAYLMGEQGRLTIEEHPISGAKHVPDDEAWMWINMYTNSTKPIMEEEDE